MKTLTSWARIRKSESDLILRETKAFVGRDFDGYGRKEIRKQVTLRDGSVEDRFVRRSARVEANSMLSSARNDANFLLTEG
jgi:hypothetical protein